LTANVVIDTNTWRITTSANAQTTTGRLTGCLFDIVGNRTGKEQQRAQGSLQAVEIDIGKVICVDSFSQGFQVFRRKRKIGVRTRGSNTHCNHCEKTSRKELIMSGTEGGNRVGKIRSTCRESTTIDTTILIEKGIHCTIG